MRELLLIPDPRLRMRSKAIKTIDGSVKELAEEMLLRLKELRSIGLAAPQFGEMVRLIVLNVRGFEVVLVNPEIVKMRDMRRVVEQCRSIPGKKYGLQRPKIVKVRGLDLAEKWRGVKGHDVLAQCLCHEIDHLNGVLIDSIGHLV